MYLLNNGYNCQLLRHVQGFPLLRLLRADLTSKGSSFALLLAGLPYHILMEHLWISQVPDASLHTCHDLITPLTRHNLTITIALHGLRWRYKPRQSGPIVYRSDTSTSGTRIPYGLYDSLCTLHLYCSSSCELIADKYLRILDSAIGATLDTGGWLNLA